MGLLQKLRGIKMLYKAPSGKDLREFMNRHNISSADVGKLTDTTPRTVRRWTSDTPNSPRIPYCVMFVLLHHFKENFDYEHGLFK